MLRTQRAVPRIPPRLLAAALRGMERESFVHWSFGHYLRIAAPLVRQARGRPARTSSPRPPEPSAGG